MTTDYLDENQPGLEKMLYGTFVRNHTCYKKSQIPSYLIPLDNKIQLPNGSILHLMDNLTETGLPRDMPLVLQNIFILNEVNRKYIYHNIELPKVGDTFYVKKNHIFRTAGFSRVAVEFRKKYRSLILQAMELKPIVNNNIVLLVMNHNPLWRLRVLGRMAEYNRFDLILRSVLQKISEMPDNKYQYIHIPLSTRLYPKLDIMRPIMRGIDTSTIFTHDDMSYYMMLHVFGWLYDKSEVSLFDLLPKEMYTHINLIFTVKDKAIIYNLADLKDMAINDTVILMIMRHLNVLKLSGVTDSIDLTKIVEMDETEFDQTVDERVEKQVTEDRTEMLSEDTDVGIDTQAKVAVSKAPTPKTPPPTIEEERSIATKEYIEKVPDITPAQKRRLTIVADKHKSIVVGGQPIVDILKEEVDITTTTSEIKCLEGVIPDRSMLRSSVIDMDKLYIKKLYKKDMVQVLTSFSKNGMHLVSHEEQPVVDELNRVTEHKAVYEDSYGKGHTIKYKVPIIDSDGNFFVNGIISKMKKQQVNLPICKISNTRVSLAASYKTLVEKNVSKAHTYYDFIHAYIDKTNTEKEVIKVSYGSNSYPHKLPYEYTKLGAKYNSFSFGKYLLHFNFEDRISALNAPADITDLESKYGVLCGRVTDNSNVRLFIGMDNRVRIVDITLGGVDSITTIYELLTTVSSVSMPMVSEWTDLKILDQKLPIMFILGYRFGLIPTLKHLGLKYAVYEKGVRVEKEVTDLLIKFRDKTIVFNRYPIDKSLIVAGLLRFDVSKYDMEEFDGKDVYYELLTDKNISNNYIKGIDTFFELFLDPLTRDVLVQMGEPTNIRDLLIRASTMLSTEEHVDAASMANYRIRSYERVNAILYDEMARQFAQYRQQRGKGKVFSINPEAVFQRIIQDQSVVSISEINPVHDIKEKSGFTYTGVGGRSATSFVIGDRKYPDDGVGIISEATPDSGKVAITAQTSMNPNIANLRGMYTFPAKYMSFPPNEVDRLKKRLKTEGTISTTRISSEKGKYKVGDTVDSALGVKLKILKVQTFTNIKDHPYYNELTGEWKKEIGNNPFDVITLEPAEIEPTKLLSVAALLMPGSTNDDQQRIN